MIYLYYGENIYLIEEKLRAFKERYIVKFSSALNIHTLDISEGGISALREVCEGRSLFDETVLVFVTGIENVSAEEIIEVLESLDVYGRKDIVAVFSAKTTQKVDKQVLSFFKKNGTVQEFVPYSGNALIKWVQELAIKCGAKISYENAKLLLERRGEDMLSLSHEIEKLSTYSKGGAIEKEDIEGLVLSVFETDVFKTVDALSRKNSSQAMSLLWDHKKRGDDPFQIMGMFAYQSRVLLLVKDAEENGTERSLAADHGLHPFVIKKNKALSKALNMEEIRRLHSLVADADYKAKTGREEAYTALENVILSFI